MRAFGLILLAVALAIGSSATANANFIIASNAAYDLVVSEATDVGDPSVGPDLVAVILSVVSKAGAEAASTVQGTVTGNLHQDQFFFGNSATPTADSFAAFGAPVSTVDTHVIVPNPLVLTASSEPTTAAAPASGEPTQIPPSSLGKTAFAPVLDFGNIAGRGAALTDLAYIVVERGSAITVDLVITGAEGTQAPALVADNVTIPIPEPSTLALLGVAGVVGLVAIRRRKK